MRQAVQHQRVQARVAGHHLPLAACDRVAVEGTVWYLDRDGMPTVVFRTGRGGTVEVAAADVTLLDRPTPPLPTEPGTTGTATVRGVPGVSVFRVWATSDKAWVSAGWIKNNVWHSDSDLADFIADPSGSSWNEKPTFHTIDGHKTAEESNLWANHDHETMHMWNMSIDLNSCTEIGRAHV